MSSVTILGLLAMATTTLAQASTTLNLFLLADNQTILGSVVNVAPTATTLFLQCPSGTDSSDCGIPSGLTVTENQSGITFTMSDPSLSQEATCKLEGTTAADCTVSISSSDTDGQTSTAMEMHFDGSSYSQGFIPVTITAGAEKLAASGSAASGGPTSPASAAASATSAGEFSWKK
jgi:hypothetical protein